MKKTDQNTFYVVKTIKLIDKKDAKKIQEKQESLRIKRQLRKSRGKEG